VWILSTFPLTCNICDIILFCCTFCWASPLFHFTAYPVYVAIRIFESWILLTNVEETGSDVSTRVRDRMTSSAPPVVFQEEGNVEVIRVHCFRHVKTNRPGLYLLLDTFFLPSSHLLSLYIFIFLSLCVSSALLLNTRDPCSEFHLPCNVYFGANVSGWFLWTGIGCSRNCFWQLQCPCSNKFWSKNWALATES